ncbi:hypothetical protein AB1Y20_019300 [Prymnesium parvum]|uniref:Bromo domain-containing protein n=1 Tax=Prymnesium parvum TaxID=97485 RepID=A0AB34JSB3_PRYPA
MVPQTEDVHLLRRVFLPHRARRTPLPSRAVRVSGSMPPRKKDLIPPEARGTPRRNVKPVARFGIDDDDDDDDDMPLGQSRVLAAQSRLVQGSMIERCRALLDLMQLRPDAFIFAKPVSVDDVPDYLDIIENPCDYSTVRGKLDRHEYGDDHLSFANDMRRIFMNACKYNWKPDHEFHIAARQSLQAFETNFSRMLNGSSHADQPRSGGASSAPAKKRPRAKSLPGSTGGAPAEPKKPRVEHSDECERTMKDLAEYLTSRGGSASMVDGWYVRTEYRKEGMTKGTYDKYFFTPNGKRFRSKAEIARFFDLAMAPAPRAKIVDPKQLEKQTAKEQKLAQREQERTQASIERERALEYARRYPIADEKLPMEPPPNEPLGKRPAPSVPPALGVLPASQTGSLLQAWDFIRTAGGEMQLPDYAMHELSAELRASKRSEPSQKLIDLHILLLQRVLADERAKLWWPDPPSLQPRLTEAAKSKQKNMHDGGHKKQYWDIDRKPPVKCDLGTILASSEPGKSIRRWVSVLEAVAPMRTNTGVPIRDAVMLAIKCTRDPEVQRYLNRALRYYKGNAAGTTKFAALWLAAQMRRQKPELWTHEAMQADAIAAAEESAEAAGGAGEHEESAVTEEGGPLPSSPFNDDDEMGEMDEAAAEAAAEAALAEAGVGEEDDLIKVESGGMEGSKEADAGEAGEAELATSEFAESGADPAEEVSQLEPPDKVDEHLWPGAAAAGWNVQAVGRNGRKLGHWAYIGPSSTMYTSLEEAQEYRELESKRIDETQAVSAFPELLVGWRVSVYWVDDGGGWYLGQVMSYNKQTKLHCILYDDQTQEEVDLSVEKYRLWYQLQPQFLSRMRQPRRPADADVTLWSWPLLLAACVVRLDDYWPENQSNKESVEPEAYADIRAPVTVSTGTDVDANGVPNPPMASLTTTEDDVIETEDSSMEATAFGSAEAPIWQSAAKQLLAAHPTEVLKVYTRLPASAKLALVNMLIDVACDTKAVTQAFDRINAKRLERLTEHENEDKAVKRNLKEEKEATRTRLRAELEQRKARGELTAEEAVQDDITEAQVTAEMHRLAEAEACGVTGEKVLVLTRDALGKTESDLAVTLELRSSGIDETGSELSQDEMLRNDTLRNEIRRRRDTLPRMRDSAQAQLRAACESGEKADLAAAIAAGKEAALEGHDDGVTSGYWVLNELRDAYVKLHESLKHEKDEFERARRREQLLAVRGRTELLGIDRYGRRYWAFDTSGGADTNIWVQPRTDDLRGVIRESPPDASVPDAWQFFSGDEDCLAIAASLDSRGIRERALQSALRAHAQLNILRRRAAAAEAAEKQQQAAMEEDESASDRDDDDDYAE